MVKYLFPFFSHIANRQFCTLRPLWKPHRYFERNSSINKISHFLTKKFLKYFKNDRQNTQRAIILLGVSLTFLTFSKSRCYISLLEVIENLPSLKHYWKSHAYCSQEKISASCFILNIRISLLWVALRVLFFYFSSNHQMCSLMKGVLKNFAKFTGKHLCQSLFFNKVAGRESLTHIMLFQQRG